ncbi:rap1 GTPase-GDP dissociation stimulator 1 isoform X1 [Stigmatopora nigra]
MGHSNVPLTLTYSCSNKDKRKTSQLQPYAPNDNLHNALGAIRVLGLERIEAELKPHLCTVLLTIQEKNKGAAEQVVISGILPILALLLRDRGPLVLLTAQLVAELAKESVIRKGFGDAGLVTALLSVLTCGDQNLLRLAVQAIARVSHDSCEYPKEKHTHSSTWHAYSSLNTQVELLFTCLLSLGKHQQLLLRRGAVPRLVAVLLRFPCNEALEEVCLRALCNLSGMSVTEEAGMVWERGTPAQPGECIFCGVSPRKCGLVTSVTVVRVCRWAPAQYAVSVELVQRSTASFLNFQKSKRPTRCFPFFSIGRRSKTASGINPRRSSLKTLVFHTFI